MTESTRYSAAIPGDDLPSLSAEHQRELVVDSAIKPAVIAARGYVTVARPKAGLLDAYGRDTRQQLQAMGFPAWATREDYYYPGLLVPQYTPQGDRYPGQFKPRNAVPNRDGKMMRYASAKGGVRLDVHPWWSADRGQEDPTLLPAIRDHRIPLWITEGVKKADSCTSRGLCTVALSGVFNWRNSHGTLADWENVRLKDREIVICFDSDAITKPLVAQAMSRLGKWLASKGAKKVWYLVVPPAVEGAGACKGIDDYFALGGTVGDLEKVMESRPPQVTSTEDRWTDARLAETVATEVLDGRYCWAVGMGWLSWNGVRWADVDVVTVLETVRQWALGQFGEAAARMRADDKSAAAEVDGWRTMLSASRQRTVLDLARGIVARPAGDFDADPDLVNTPSGVVNLLTGEVLPHDPELLCTKITSGSYRPGYIHPDWQRALEVLPTATMDWMQVRVGQAITGYTTPDGVFPILRGGGENGKGLMFTDGLLPALGGYGAAASPKLFESGQHSEERADLHGQRLMVVEELPEGRALNISAVKGVADVGRIRARHVYQKNKEFDTSHSIFITTNYDLVVAEVDHGTWRRLALVVFPYTFIKPGDPIRNPEFERRGDPTLKMRIKANKECQHDAIVTWAIEGALRWYANVAAIEQAVAEDREAPASILLPPVDVAADTLRWRTQADRILGYWCDCLIVDPAAIILMSELTTHFNAWLESAGHAPWAKETFGPRFRDHQETKAHRIARPVKKRTASISGQIVRMPTRYGVTPTPLPAQADVLTGLRWRTEGDE